MHKHATTTPKTPLSKRAPLLALILSIIFAGTALGATNMAFGTQDEVPAGSQPTAATRTADCPPFTDLTTSIGFTANPTCGPIEGGTNVTITPAAKFTAVSAGKYHSLALDADGHIWAWGYNNNGQIGDGTIGSTIGGTSTPVEVKPDTTFKAIAAGYISSLALDTTGHLWAWGSNGYGQFGNGSHSYDKVPIPEKVSTATTFKAISAGDNHTLALDITGHLWAWGQNQYGQIGNNTTSSLYNPVASPVEIKPDTTFTTISANNTNSAAIDTAGHLWAWGGNSKGTDVVGDGSTGNHTTPVEIKPNTTFTDVSTSDGHTLAIDSTHHLWSWGVNTSGEVGNNTNTEQRTPAEIQPTTTFTAVSARGGQYLSSMAIDTDGQLWVWGYGVLGSFGNGIFGPTYLTPTYVALNTPLTSISTGICHTLALDANGHDLAWGYNLYGQVGNGSTSSYISRPTDLSHTDAAITSVSIAGTTITTPGTAGSPVTVATPRYAPDTVDLTINYTHNGTAESVTLPNAFTYHDSTHTVTFTTDGGSTPPATQHIKDKRLLARPANPSKPGSVFMGWYAGGDTPYDFTAPVNGDIILKARWSDVKTTHAQGPDLGKTRMSVTMPSGTTFTTIKAADGHTMALDAQGNIWGWGDNNHGRLGTGETKKNTDGTTSPVSTTTPKQAKAPTGTVFTSVSAGTYHTAALDGNGNAWGWGDNAQGQVGNNLTTGSTTSTPAPTTMPAHTAFTQINAGKYHNVALDTDGKAWSWGYNGNGQLGDRTQGGQKNLPTAVIMPQNTQFITVSAGTYHTVALDTKGNAWGWGYNASGQLGDDTTTGASSTVPSPTKMPANTKFTRISAGAQHTAALDINGQVWTWGRNDNGQLGNGPENSGISQATPINVTPAGVSFTSIAAGNTNTVAIDTQGNIWTWGTTGTTTNFSPTKTATPAPDTTYTHIAAGSNHIETLDSNGVAWGWGDNAQGQLGDNSKTTRPTPVAPQLPSPSVTSISFSGNDGSAPKNTTGATWATTTPAGTAGPADIVVNYSLGGNPQPAVTLPGAYTYTPSYKVSFATDGGSTPPDTQPLPSQSLIQRPSNPSKPGCIFTGWYQGSTPYDFTAPVNNDITLTAHWASPTLTRKDGPDAGGSKIAVTMPPSTAFTTIKAAKGHTMAVDTQGNIWGWGDNNSGRLGTGGTSTTTPTRAAAPAGTMFTSVSAGTYHTAALDSKGNAWGWGYNMYGQVGNDQLGSAPNQITPVQTTMPAHTTFTQVNAGAYHTVAIDTNGNAWGWGKNSNGQLGNNSKTDQHTPAEADMPDDVKFVGITTGDTHTMALDDLGNAWGWGSNSDGQLGNTTTGSSTKPSPTEMPADTTFTRISAGTYHTAALDSDGNVWTWGKNDSGQLGDGTKTSHATPYEVSTPLNVKFTSVAAGDNHTVAIDTKGNVWAWGTDGDGTENLLPTLAARPATGTTYTHIATGDTHLVALDSNGAAWGWGGNDSGQLGDGTKDYHTTPLQVRVPTAQVTAIKFGTQAGSTPKAGSDGSWSTITPKHDASAVNVTVSYSLGGSQQPDVTLTNAYTYFLTVSALPFTGGSGFLALVLAVTVMLALLCLGKWAYTRHRIRSETWQSGI